MDMRIGGAYSTYNAYSVKKAVTPAARGRGVASVGDSVSIGATAHDFHVARRAVNEVPDVRNERITQLQQQLQSGSYSVNASAVAARIFGTEE
ncbi:MAG: flagellar biosynthesis anti-sigma factor FlgM [Defluviitaleaceae bacterium]|nr:flagellar biosynthesis anti-sigma factor FlgM [Defluviitaleaceae bacterium]MCL2273327.1 flagellar biosynthesis anti-sigma factor FlgM [Defluviitaleaceae bacterium]